MPNCLELDIGNVVFSGWNQDGYLEVAFDSYGTEGGTEDGAEPAPPGAAAYEAHHPLGILARPLDPVLDQGGNADPSQSCNVLIGLEGGIGHAIPLEDTRLMPLLPQLQKGESLLYGSAWGQFVRMHADGSISLSTTENPVYNAGKQGDLGAPTTLWLRPDGSLEFTSRWGRILFDKTGFYAIHASGAQLNMGAIGGLPSPLDKIGSHFSVQAGMVSHDASIIAQGPSNGVPGGPPALATPTLAALSAICTAVVAAIGALPASLPSGGQAQATALQSALGSILSTAAAAVPSPNTSS